LTTHLTAEQIGSFAAGTTRPEEVVDLLVHLCRCIDCYADCLREVEGRSDDEGEAAYDAPVARAIAAAQRQARARELEEAAADETFAAYLHVVDDHYHGDGPRLTGWALCRKLLELSQSFRHRDAREMLRYANCAQSVASLMDAEDYPAPLLADFQARVAAELANAYRVNDLLEDADDYMQRAEHLLKLGTGDVLLRGRIIDLKSSLRNSERRFVEARQCLRAAQALYRRAGDMHLVGRILIKRGIYSGYDGDPAEGLRLVHDGLALIEPMRDTELFAVSLHAQVGLLNECGRFAEARAALAESDLTQRYAGDHLSLLKLRWEEGRIAAGLGELSEAEVAFQEVRRAFTERELHYKAGLVALELALVWLRQGKSSAELSPLVHELVATFRACRIDREAVAALLVLREACERERVSLELLCAVTSFLRRFERDPGARFEHLPVA